MKRSRKGCLACKQRKIKCDEQRPECSACVRRGESCDYSLQLSWQAADLIDTPLPPSINVVVPNPSLEFIHVNGGFQKRRRHIKSTATERHGMEEKGLLGAELENSLEPAIDLHREQGSSDSLGTGSFPDLSSFSDFQSSQSMVNMLPQSIITSFIPRQTSSLIPIEYQEPYEFFLHVTAEELVPVPYAENPFQTLLSRIALHAPGVACVMAAYGSSHRSIITQYSDPVLTESLCEESALQLHKELAMSGSSEIALTIAMLLSSLEADRGNYAIGAHYNQIAIRIIERQKGVIEERGDYTELHLLNVRMVAYMEAMGKLTMQGRSDLPLATWWPSWSSGFDYVTGVDLNFLPLFAEVANLANERKHSVLSLKKLRKLNNRALYILMRLNDYKDGALRPYDELSAMSVLNQQALKIHVYRRVLAFPKHHTYVLNSVAEATATLERYISPQSKIQESMSFIVVTLASEASTASQKRTYLTRLQALDNAGFVFARNARASIEASWKLGQSLITSPNLTLLM